MSQRDELLNSYIGRGWKLVKIPTKSKGPAGTNAKGWQTNYNVTPRAIGTGNVGILLGKPSGGLVDIDLDWIEAGDFAEYFLPDTGLLSQSSNASMPI